MKGIDQVIYVQDGLGFLITMLHKGGGGWDNFDNQNLHIKQFTDTNLQFVNP